MPEQNLNPDAVAAATMAVISDELGYIETMSGSEHVARLAVSAYLSALPAQPDTVNSVEELDHLPVLSVIRTDKGWVYERRGLGWMTTGLSDVADLSTNTLVPSTVLYRPVEG